MKTGKNGRSECRSSAAEFKNDNIHDPLLPVKKALKKQSIHLQTLLFYGRKKLIFISVYGKLFLRQVCHVL